MRRFGLAGLLTVLAVLPLGIASDAFFTPSANLSEPEEGVVRLAVQRVAPGEQVLRLAVELPEGYKINDIAPFSMVWTSDVDSAVLGEGAEQTIVEPAFPLELPVSLSEGEAVLTGDLVIYYCEHESVGVCLVEQVRLEVPINAVKDGEDGLTVTYAVPEPLEIGWSF